VSRDPAAMERANQWSNEVIGAAIEVHRCLGPGLLESAYEACLCQELEDRRIPFERQVPLPVMYKGRAVDAAYQIDEKVGGLLILELKPVEKLEPIHQA
jgi:GxxExxY protein